MSIVARLASAPWRRVRPGVPWGVLCGLPCVLLLSGVDAPLAAQMQPPMDGLAADGRAPVVLRDYSERRFGSPDGVRSLAVFAAEVLSDGSLWIGTDAGPHRFTGARFDLVPIPTVPAHVRAIVRTADGAVWFGTRVGAVRRDVDGTMRVFAEADGLPAGTVYSLLETDAFDGVRRLVAATGTGVAMFVDERWQSMPLPPGLVAEGLVVRPRARPGRNDELWLGTTRGVAARWRDGAWSEVYGPAQGLAVRGVEQFAVMDDAARTVYAATSDGVFRFSENDAGGRWTHLAGSPGFSYRLTTVPQRDGAHDLWVGTLDGLLVRYRGTSWDTVRLRSAEPRTPVHALTGVRGHAGGYAVYVGTFGDGLVRLSVGRGASLVSERSGLRLGINAVLEEPLGRPGVVWVSTVNFGVVEIDGAYARPLVAKEDIVDGRAMTMFVRPVPAGAPEIWVGAGLGAWRREGGRWVPRRDGMERSTVFRYGLEREHDPASSLLAATEVGLLRWDGSRWARVDSTPAELVFTILGETVADSSLWIGGAFGTMVRRQGAWHSDTSLAHPDIAVRALCRMPASENGRTSASAGRLVAGTNRGVYVREADGTRWLPLPDRMRSFLRSEIVHALRCDDPARVLVATSDGVAVLDLAGRDAATWQMITMLGPADGLPSAIMMAIGEGGSERARWIGTAHGMGRIDVRTLPMPDASLFSLQIASGHAGRVIADGEHVPFAENRINIRLTLPTYHREEDLRYRIAVEGPVQGYPPIWTSNDAIAYPALPPGRYTIRAWARDYAGREYGPISQDIVVDHAPWRSPAALLGYGVAVLLLLAGAHRWRLRTLHDRAEELAASEQRARASERQFRALFDRAFDANLLVRGGLVTAANAAAAELLRAHETAIVGRSLAELGLPAEPVRDGGAADPVETEVRLTDERTIPVAVTVTTIMRDDGPMQHWVLRDLSGAYAAEAERQRLESQVREAQKLESLGTLAGGVAHDFNNLLGVIHGNAELARDTLDDRDEVADHLAAVLDASERARDLVRQILTFSRRATPHERIVDLGAVVRALVPMLRSLIPRTVELDLIGGDGTYPLHGDVTQLQQLLFNLCSNAEYAMRPTNGGRLEIRLDTVPDDRVDPPGRAVRLGVRDTGVGMTSEVRDRVFEPFFTTKPTGEGTGLGLSVLHGIVASHGGRVRVESVPGAGSLFEVLFPLADDPGNGVLTYDTSAPAQEMTGEAANAIYRGARIVLVDDEPAVARVVERALTRLGCRVRTFNDPGEALAAVATAPQEVDLVITDQTMPGMTGDVLTEAVHDLRAQLPVVIVTGYSYRLTPERLMAIGAAAVLQKPVPLSQLASTVATALRGERPEAG